MSENGYEVVDGTKLSKIRWTGHVFCFASTLLMRAVGFHGTLREQVALLSKSWLRFFVKALNKALSAIRLPRAVMIHWATLARDR